MNAIAGQRIQEHGERSHEGLTLTGSHLGNLTLVQHGTTEELYVIVYHLPLEVIATGCPVVVINRLVTINRDEVVLGVASQLTVKISGSHHSLLVLGKTACSILDDAEGSGQHLVERHLIVVERLFLQLVYLVEDGLTLVDGRVLDGSLQLSDLLSLGLAGILHILLYFFCLCTEFVIAQSLDIGVFGFHFLYDGLDQLHVTS